MAASVVLPVVLFAGLTGVSQVVSPARGQSLLPDLPSIATRSPAPGRVGRDLRRAGTARGQPVPPRLLGEPLGWWPGVDPVVTAAPDGGTPRPLRQLTVSPGHFSEVVVLTPGPWRFAVTTPYGTSSLSFTVTVTVPEG